MHLGEREKDESDVNPLHNNDNSYYSSHAKALYELRSGNLPEELPEEDDLKVLKKYCVEQIEAQLYLTMR